MTEGAGAAAATVAHVMTYPMDTVRRRMQLQGAGGAANIYKNALDCAMQMTKKEGVKSLYRSPPLRASRASRISRISRILRGCSRGRSNAALGWVRCTGSRAASLGGAGGGTDSGGAGTVVGAKRVQVAGWSEQIT